MTARYSMTYSFPRKPRNTNIYAWDKTVKEPPFSQITEDDQRVKKEKKTRGQHKIQEINLVAGLESLIVVKI